MSRSTLHVALWLVAPAALLASASPAARGVASAALADSLDVRALARAVADSLRPRRACAVAAPGLGDPVGPADWADPLPAALARALAVPLAAPGRWPACARPGAATEAGRLGVLVLVALREVTPGNRGARVRVGLRVQAWPGVPRSGYAEDWPFRVARADDGRWYVTGRSDRRIT